MTVSSRTILHLLTLAILVLLGASSMSRSIAEKSPTIPETSVIGWLELAPEVRPGSRDIYLSISGRAFSPAALRGRYTLEISRSGTTGVSNTVQGGVFSTEPGKVASLSQTTINIHVDDRVDIVLKLFSGEVEVFRSTLQSRFSQNT